MIHFCRPVHSHIIFKRLHLHATGSAKWDYTQNIGISNYHLEYWILSDIGKFSKVNELVTTSRVFFLSPLAWLGPFPSRRFLRDLLLFKFSHIQRTCDQTKANNLPRYRLRCFIFISLINKPRVFINEQARPFV